MIELAQGDLLEANADALVNAVNTVGVMGKGIALQFKRTFPENFKVYEAACKSGQLQPGKMLVCKAGDRYIINFPTKKHWRGASKLEYIEAGLRDLVEVIARHHIRSIALPALGCGAGGLDWSAVFPLIQQHLSPLDDIRVIVFAPTQ
jgi:O-acetyl-ADP-ribose deacetylase (regulator of RNase III)